MDKESPSEASVRLKKHLAECLVAQRDSLVELAMTLRDLQFEIDSIQRSAAAREVVQILERFRGMAHGDKTSADTDPR